MSDKPDPELTNDNRAARGAAVLDRYRELAGAGLDDNEALCDLLADLMHWCDREPEVNFDAALNEGYGHYAAEVAGDDP